MALALALALAAVVAVVEASKLINVHQGREKLRVSLLGAKWPVAADAE